MPRALAHILRPLAELSVVGSYGRGGHALSAPFFDPADSPRLDGRTILITGATSGIGLEASHILAARGATLLLVGRSPDKLQAVAQAIPGALTFRCDLSSLADVRTLAAALPPRLDVLVHNAGLIGHERHLTPEGHEHTFATHVLSPFLLTHLLADRLRASRGRVIWVSSGGMYTQKLDLDRAQALTGPWDGVRAYAQHKRAQVLLSECFDRILAPEATSHAMHPGWVDTPGVAVGLPRFHRWMRGLLRTPAQGADTIAWLCGTPSVEGRSGRFWLDRRPRRTELFPGTHHDESDREALWELCAKLTNTPCQFPRIMKFTTPRK